MDIQKCKQQTVEKVNFDSEYFRPLKKLSTLEFLLRPAPHGKIVNCKIRKGKGILSELQFYLEDNSNGYHRMHMLMRTHRRITTAKLYHLISAINYDEFWEKGSDEPTCGRIVSNISRKKFKLDLQYNDQYINKEILSVEYKYNVGEPRKITANAILCSPNNSNQDKVRFLIFI